MQNQTPLYALYATYTVEEALKRLQTTFKGLSHNEAMARQVKYGLNTIQENEKRWWYFLLRQFNSFFAYTFIGIGIVSLIAQQYQNAIIIFLCLCINAFISFYKEYQAHHDVQELKKLLLSSVQAVRDGQEEQIPSTHVVPGDIIQLYPGSVVPADMRLFFVENCAVDESALTGESAVVRKNIEAIKTHDSDIFKSTNICFAGTTVVEGEAYGIVFATGSATQLGEIAYVTASTIQESDFSYNIERLARLIFYLIIVTVLILFVVQLMIRGIHKNIFDFFIFITALAISVTPEALPVVVTFGLARGAKKLSHKKVIVKRLSALEDLGSIEILCTDKTGTLTENVMQVADVYGDDSNKGTVILYGLLAAETAFNQLTKKAKSFDTALWEYAKNDIQEKVKMYQKVHEFPFDFARYRNSVIVKKDDTYEVVVRGISEELFARSQGHQQDVVDWMKREEQQGKRTLVIAKKKLNAQEVAGYTSDQERNLDFVGVVSFIDPVKKTVAESIQLAGKLGLRIKILSGDSKEVCGAVAAQIGLIDDAQNVLTGYQLSQQSEQEQEKSLQDYTVFARVTPEQKYIIIKKLKEHAIVGYMGDGINDAPALKMANVSLAVQDASDIARQVADIILLKKSLHVIVEGIAEGRTSVVNTLKYVKTTIASSFGNFYSLACISLFIDYLPMLPVQLLCVNLLSDLPMIAISTDTVDMADIRKPRLYVLKDILLFSVLLGGVSTLFDFVYFYLFKGYMPTVLQTGWFVMSVITELCFIFIVRSRLFFWKARFPSMMLVALSVGVAIITCIAPYTIIGQHILQLVPLTMHHIQYIAAIIIAYCCCTALLNYLYYRVFSEH